MLEARDLQIPDTYDLKELHTIVKSVIAPFLEKLEKLSTLTSDYKRFLYEAQDEQLTEIFATLHDTASISLCLENDITWALIPYLVQLRHTGIQDVEVKYKHELKCLQEENERLKNIIGLIMHQ